MKLVCLIVVVVVVFMLSWFLYCFVSFISIFKGDYLFFFGEVEVFEFMVKVLVMYNFFVYIIMNRCFCRILSVMILCCRYCKWYYFRKSKDLSIYIKECDIEIRFLIL